jgi:hypothetical protein
MGTRGRLAVVLLVACALVLAGLLVRSAFLRPDDRPRTPEEHAMIDASRRAVENVLGRPLTDAELRMIVIDRRDGRMAGAHVRPPLSDELRRASDRRTQEMEGNAVGAPATAPASQPATDATPKPEAPTPNAPVPPGP